MYTDAITSTGGIKIGYVTISNKNFYEELSVSSYPGLFAIIPCSECAVTGSPYVFIRNGYWAIYDLNKGASYRIYYYYN